MAGYGVEPAAPAACSAGLFVTRNRTHKDKLEVDRRTLIHHFVARSKIAVGIAADIIKQPHGPVPCLSFATIGAAGLRQPSEALRTRYCTRMKRRAIAASLRQYATIVLSSKWPVTTPVTTGIIKMSVGRQLDGYAITARFFESALAFPISTESIKVPVPRNLYRQASVTASVEAAFALPTG
jgi:hypothetical protein